MATKFEIDVESADRITVLNLKDHRRYLKAELTAWKKNPWSETNPDGYWLHQDDVVSNVRTVEALNVVIKHYGEE